MTYEQAADSLPEGSTCTSTFGYPGNGGYAEYHRTPDGRRVVIANGPWDAVRPFTWTVKQA